MAVTDLLQIVQQVMEAPAVLVVLVVVAHNEMVRLAVRHLHQVKVMQVVLVMRGVVLTQAAVAVVRERLDRQPPAQVAVVMVAMDCNRQ